MVHISASAGAAEPPAFSLGALLPPVAPGAGAAPPPVVGIVACGATAFGG